MYALERLVMQEEGASHWSQQLVCSNPILLEKVRRHTRHPEDWRIEPSGCLADCLVTSKPRKGDD